jgi:rSAM/selenodomain-associated transferase 1
MRPRRRVVIFVRAPQVGAVKRRLATSIGGYAAWRFYRRETSRVIFELCKALNLDVSLAVTPDCFARGGRFWPPGIKRVPQGHGDLGARMSRVIMSHTPEPVVVIGSDIPGLTAELVGSAFDALDTHEAVIGPAHDGGYWLVGVRQRPGSTGLWRPGLFRHVRWSSCNALEDTVQSFPSSWRVARLVTLRDVDIEADFNALGGRNLLGL